MTRVSRMRFLSSCTLIGGILFAVYDMGLVMGASRYVGAPGSLTNLHFMAFLAAFFTMLGVIGLYAYQADAGGWAGVAAFVFSLLGIVVFQGFAISSILFLRVAAFYDQGQFSLLSDVWLKINAFAISHLMLFLGLLSFGLLTLRTKIYPRTPAFLIVVGGVVGGAGTWLSSDTDLPFGIYLLLSIGLAWMSIWLIVKFRSAE